MFTTTCCILVPFILLYVFFVISQKSERSKETSSCFECGFSGRSPSRLSFAVHFFLVGLIFLFLDLEICILFFILYSENLDTLQTLKLFVLCAFLLFGLLVEIYHAKIDWVD